MQLDVSAANFETWLKRTRLLAAHDTRLVVEAGSTFAASHLSEQLAVVVRRAAEEVADRPLTVEFVAPGMPERTEARPLRRPLAPRLG
ncbi:MAG: DnaA N-terminal domain-containing protein, partial [Dehalococcoidia bacterium]